MWDACHMKQSAEIKHYLPARCSPREEEHWNEALSSCEMLATWRRASKWSIIFLRDVCHMKKSAEMKHYLPVRCSPREEERQNKALSSCEMLATWRKAPKWSIIFLWDACYVKKSAEIKHYLPVRCSPREEERRNEALSSCEMLATWRRALK